MTIVATLKLRARPKYKPGGRWMRFVSEIGEWVEMSLTEMAKQTATAVAKDMAHDSGKMAGAFRAMPAPITEDGRSWIGVGRISELDAATKIRNWKHGYWFNQEFGRNPAQFWGKRASKRKKIFLGPGAGEKGTRVQENETVILPMVIYKNIRPDLYETTARSGGPGERGVQSWGMKPDRAIRRQLHKRILMFRILLVARAHALFDRPYIRPSKPKGE